MSANIEQLPVEHEETMEERLERLQRELDLTIRQCRADLEESEQRTARCRANLVHAETISRTTAHRAAAARRARHLAPGENHGPLRKLADGV